MKYGLNTRMALLAFGRDRPVSPFVTAGPDGDCSGAAALLGRFSRADRMLAGRDYDADWFSEALKATGTEACILGLKSRRKAGGYDKRRNRTDIMVHWVLELEARCRLL
ncbi:hypothetical protein [Pseudogemmobacter bohemicus]|uniref:hypothetical protein n=1 Tax=Pseudogemmobacter bohemicus TaxID=2250708 RepID=UPI0038CD392D